MFDSNIILKNFVQRRNEMTTEERISIPLEAVLNSAGGLLHHRASLCPLLFTARNSDRVNYGEAGFHKFRGEIWSDKFKSVSLAPRSRSHCLTRARSDGSLREIDFTDFARNGGKCKNIIILFLS